MENERVRALRTERGNSARAAAAASGARPAWPAAAPGFVHPAWGELFLPTVVRLDDARPPAAVRVAERKSPPTQLAAKKHLFICGCPQSGTTALWRLMVAHPGIFLGVERYGHLARHRGRIGPALFEKQKFFRIEPGQTFYSDLAGKNDYYSDGERRYDEAAWVGDNIPMLFNDYSGIEANFENAHILFIFRNIIDVAGSYQNRSRSGTANGNRDYRGAVKDWHRSLKTTRDFLSMQGRRTSVAAVSYEEMFLREADLTPLFDWLGLEYTASVRRHYRFLLSRSRDLDGRRGDAINSAQRHYIAQLAPFHIYRALLKSRLVLREATAGGSASAVA